MKNKFFSKISSVVLAVCTAVVTCSCGSQSNKKPEDKSSNANFKASDYILDKSVSDTPKILDGFNFWVQTVTVDNKNLLLLKKSVKEHKIGSINSGLAIKGAEEWGFGFHHLNGQTDGVGRMIRSDFSTTPVDRADALGQMLKWISRQYDISDGDKWHSMTGFYFYQHYAAEKGATEIGCEIGEGISSFQQHIAFTRGAGRQYKRPWYIDFSMWNYGFCYYPENNSPYGERGGPEYGSALNLLERAAVMSYMSGANMFLAEAGGAFSLLNELGSDGLYKVSPYGEVCRKFYKFTNEHSDRGTNYTPFAIALDYYHGMDGGWTDYTTTDKAFTVFDYNDGDRFTDAVLDIFYSDTRDIFWCGPYTPSREKNKMRNDRKADSVDVVLQNASKEVLSSYPCVILSGDIKFSDAEKKNYQAYVKDGGCLVMNTAYLNKFPDYKAKYDGKSRCEFKDGKGSVIIFGKDFDATELKAIVEEKLDELYPVTVSENVQQILSVKDNTLYVTLINNEGIYKEGNKPTVVDESKAKSCKVTFKGKQNIKSVKEIYNGYDTKLSGKDISITLPAGGIAIIEMNF